MSSRLHTGEYGRSLSLPTPVSTRIVRPSLRSSQVWIAELALVRLGIPEVGRQPAAVLVPRAGRAVREELVRGHLDRAVELLDAGDGDVAQNDLLHGTEPGHPGAPEPLPRFPTPPRGWQGSGRDADTEGMDGPGPLGDFLQARRALLRPDDVGLRDLGPRRRVAGLRREELAQLAGVSVSYYTRLEQGLSRGASAEVLEAIARALLLDEHEAEHLNRLAGAARRTPLARRPRPEKLTDETRDLLRAVDGVPALVLGRRTDVLAWNTLGHALLAGHLDVHSPDDPAEAAEHEPAGVPGPPLPGAVHGLEAQGPRGGRQPADHRRPAPAGPAARGADRRTDDEEPGVRRPLARPPRGTLRRRVLRTAPPRRRHGDRDPADAVDRPLTGAGADRVHDPRRLPRRGGAGTAPPDERRPGASADVIPRRHRAGPAHR